MHSDAMPDPQQPIARAYSFFTRPESKAGATHTTTTTTSPPTPPPKDAMDSQPSTPPSYFQRVSHWLVRELSPSAMHLLTLRTDHPTTIPHPSLRLTVGILLHFTAGFLSSFHPLYSTVTFSGLLFIKTLDSIRQIATGVLASALVCRFVGLVEVGRMRREVLGAKTRMNKNANRAAGSDLTRETIRNAISHPENTYKQASNHQPYPQIPSLMRMIHLPNITAKTRVAHTNRRVLNKHRHSRTPTPTYTTCNGYRPVRPHLEGGFPNRGDDGAFVEKRGWRLDMEMLRLTWRFYD